MIATVSQKRRKTLLLVLLLITFSAFATDVLDLRDELGFLPCPYSDLDSNVTAGIPGHSPVTMEPQLISLGSVSPTTSVSISFAYLLPFSFRAPPRWS